MGERVAVTLQIALRSLSAVVILFILTRILGKKQISQLTMFEYILGITLGELAGFLSTDLEAHYLHGLIALLVWFTVPFLFEHITLRSRKLRLVLEGSPTVFIEQGKILEKNLHKERYTPDELMEELRKKDVFDVSEVEHAVLETSGELSVMLKKKFQTFTPSMLSMEVASELAPDVIIMEGKMISEGLLRAGRSEEWVLAELKRRGCTLKEIYLAQVDDAGEFYIDLYDDKKVMEKMQKYVRQSTDRDALQAELLKCQASLELYSMSVQSEEEKKTYARCAHDLRKALNRMDTVKSG